jgi:hypothetical protein
MTSKREQNKRNVGQHGIPTAFQIDFEELVKFCASNSEVVLQKPSPEKGGIWLVIHQGMKGLMTGF